MLATLSEAVNTTPAAKDEGDFNQPVARLDQRPPSSIFDLWRCKDPLRIEVWLHGPTDQLASNWMAGVQINLTSVTASGQAQLVLGADAWKNLLQPLWFDTR